MFVSSFFPQSSPRCAENLHGVGLNDRRWIVSSNQPHWQMHGCFFSMCLKRGRRLSIEDLGSCSFTRHHSDKMLTCLNFKSTVAFSCGLLGEVVMSACTLHQVPAAVHSHIKCPCCSCTCSLKSNFFQNDMRLSPKTLTAVSFSLQ